jgi:RsiW-degrading membrane proteinase PrsW (M82 family)
VGVLRRRWLQVLVSGLVLLFLVERTLVATSNPNYVPSVILLGAFLVPISFVTYLYERLPSWDVPLPALAVCFLWGGVLGTVVAGTLEYEVARALGFLPKLLIGLIEESANHMAWTGLVCAVLWRERLKVGHATLNWRVLGAFLTAVVLHVLWDTFASLRSATFVEFLGVTMLSLLVALVSLVLLLRRVREARRAEEGSGRVM